jgi:hypothetical protein
VNINDEKEPFDPVVKKMSLGVSFALTNNMVKANDIVLFAHEDVMILDNLFIEKLELVFSEKPEIGMVGVEGVSVLSENYQVGYNSGHYVQGNPMSNIGDGSHIANAMGIGFFPGMSSVSHYIFAVRGSLIIDGVLPDMVTIPNDKTLYAIDMSMQVMQRGYEVAVIDALVYHKSTRMRNINEIESASNDYALLVDKYKKLGVEFPIIGKISSSNKADVIRIEL